MDVISVTQPEQSHSDPPEQPVFETYFAVDETGGAAKQFFDMVSHASIKAKDSSAFAKKIKAALAVAANSARLEDHVETMIQIVTDFALFAGYDIDAQEVVRETFTTAREEAREQAERDTSQTSDEDRDYIAIILDAVIEIWRDDGGNDAIAYVSLYETVGDNTALRHVPLTARLFDLVVRQAIFAETRNTLSESALKDLVRTIEAMAMQGDVHKAYRRIAGSPDDIIFVDIGDDKGQLVRVTPEGWSVETATMDHPRFVRDNLSRPLPYPKETDAKLIDLVTKAMPLAPETDAALFTAAFLTSCYLPGGPFLVAMVTGAQGSAKSSTSKRLINLTDPQDPALHGPPKSNEDLNVVVARRHVLAYDNISKISQDMSDTFCRITHGGGVASRKLYSNDNVSPLRFQAALILNGITSPITAADLADRVLPIHAAEPAIRLSERRLRQGEIQFMAETFGAILNCVVAAMTTFDAVLDRSEADQKTAPAHRPVPRMIEPFAWAAAAGEVGGWEYDTLLEAMTRAQRELAHEQLANSVGMHRLMQCVELQIAMAKHQLATDPEAAWRSYMQIPTTKHGKSVMPLTWPIPHQDGWTAKQLLALMQDHTGASGRRPAAEQIPKTPQGVSKLLARWQKSLRVVGWTFIRSEGTDTNKTTRFMIAPPIDGSNPDETAPIQPEWPFPTDPTDPLT